MKAGRHGVRSAFAVAALVAGCGVVDRITDPPGLSINQFTATPTDIGPGGSAVLTWSIEGSESSEIDNGVGAVSDRGTRTVRPDRTTTYTLTARAGTSTAAASVRITVSGTVPEPTPTPTSGPTATPVPSATPTPGGTATATPTPSGTATATATPTPRPVATATPAPVSCGASASAASGCAVSISKPTILATGECIELNQVTVNQACPVGFGVTRAVSFTVTAHTSRTGLTWRRAGLTGDVLEPSTGAIASEGTTTVTLADTVLDSSVTIEVVQGTTVLLSFSLRHF
jgi:hypothetical protein